MLIEVETRVIICMRGTWGGFPRFVDSVEDTQNTMHAKHRYVRENISFLIWTDEPSYHQAVEFSKLRVVCFV